LTQGTCANGIVGVTIYDPFYQPFLDPPWDQTGNINPITHPTGIVGTFVNIDGDTADVAVVKIETMPEGPAHRFQGANALVCYLWADTVATQYGDVELHVVPPEQP
jgi:hypothetical protein